MRSGLVRTSVFACLAVLVLAATLAVERSAADRVVRPAADRAATMSLASSRGSATAAPTAPDPSSLAGPSTGPTRTDAELVSDAQRAVADAAGETPPPSAITSRDGWLVAAGSSQPAGAGRLVRYTVEVEEATGLELAAVAREVTAILSDPRGWISTGRFSFQRVDDPRVATVRVVVATPATVDRWCAAAGLNTAGWLSCQVAGRAMLNAERWRDGVPAYDGDVAHYRAYLVTHEVGHALGYGHVGCSGRDRLAPVMMQQSKSLGACRPNGWVAPDGG
ncbi:MAG: DUF3152 domain-containing protein [Nitriliruptorales bacterium]|nr:DUF3152 domain-containing protein [Nitriliruptorales bacterium]